MIPRLLGITRAVAPVVLAATGAVLARGGGHGAVPVVLAALVGVALGRLLYWALSALAVLVGDVELGARWPDDAAQRSVDVQQPTPDEAIAEIDAAVARDLRRERR